MATLLESSSFGNFPSLGGPERNQLPSLIPSSLYQPAWRNSDRYVDGTRRTSVDAILSRKSLMPRRRRQHSPMYKSTLQLHSQYPRSISKSSSLGLNPAVVDNETLIFNGDGCLVQPEHDFSRVHLSIGINYQDSPQELALTEQLPAYTNLPFNMYYADTAFLYSPSIADSSSTGTRPSSFCSSVTSTSEGQEKGRCPHLGCGRIFKDLGKHMLTHMSERPEKCPIVSCDYHIKGFARKYDKHRHTLTHYKGTMVCGFCPGSGSPIQKSFSRADVFKRHLTSVHAVEQTPPNSRKRSSVIGLTERRTVKYAQDATGLCSICNTKFYDAQELYEHLDNCVMYIIQQGSTDEAIDKRRPAQSKNMPRDPLRGRLKEEQEVKDILKVIPVHTQDERPFLCEFDGCERGLPGNGFLQHWNLSDHLQRVHCTITKPPSEPKTIFNPSDKENVAKTILKKQHPDVISVQCLSPQSLDTPESSTAAMTPATELTSTDDFSDNESVSDCSTVWDDDGSFTPYRNSQSTVTSIDEVNHQRPLRPILSPFKQALVDRIMTEFWTIVNQEWAANLTRCTGDTPASSNSPGGIGNSSYLSSPHMSHKKRQRDDGEEPPPEDNNGRTPKRPNSQNESTDSSRNLVRFACPYRKHAPQTYGIYEYRSCSLSHWVTTSRVKEHLYRRHRVPIQCKRCWLPFKTQEALDEHLTVINICALRPGHPAEGLTSDLEKKLKSRKKASPDQTEEQRWREIYALLFPNEVIPSPYFEPVQETAAQSPDSRAIQEYEDYSRQELPRVFRSYLEDAVNNETQHLEEHIRSHLVSIVQDCQDRMFTAYRSKCFKPTPRLAPGRPVEDVINTPESLQGSSEDSKDSTTSQNKTMVERLFQPPTPQITLRDFPDLRRTQSSHSFSADPANSFSDSGYATTFDRSACPMERTSSESQQSSTQSAGYELLQSTGDTTQLSDPFQGLGLPFDDSFAIIEEDDTFDLWWSGQEAGG